MIGSTRLVMTDIGINLFYAYYNQAKNFQPGLKPGIDEDKVVGIELGKNAPPPTPPPHRRKYSPPTSPRQ